MMRRLRWPVGLMLASFVIAGTVVGGLIAWVAVTTPVPAPVVIKRICLPDTESYDLIDIEVNGQPMVMGCNEPITTYGRESGR